MLRYKSDEDERSSRWRQIGKAGLNGLGSANNSREAAGRRAPSRKQIMAALTGLAFVFPAVTYFIMWIFVPAVYGLWLSLTNASFFGPSHFVGLSNFSSVLSSNAWWQSSLLTVFYILEVVPATLALAFLASYLINYLRLAGGFFSAVFFLPYVIPSVASAIVFELILQPGGVVNQALRADIPWLTGASWAIPAISIATAWMLFGFYVVIFLAGLQSIPSSVTEAAALDGAGRGRRLLSIEIPLLRPMILFAIVTAVAYVLTNFTTVYVMTQGGPGSATNVVPMEIYRTAFNYAQPGTAEAMAVLLVLASLIITGAEFFVLGREVRK